MRLKKVGLIAYSFSLQEGREPNICNKRLAAEVERIVAYYEIVLGIEVVVVAQWEIAKALKRVKPDYIVEEIRIFDNTTADTPEITAQAVKYVFEPLGINEVILVAQPFMQIVKCWMDVVKQGLKRITEDSALVRWIGFDPDSDQWWCRGIFRLFFYAVVQQLGGLAAPKYEGGSFTERPFPQTPCPVSAQSVWVEDSKKSFARPAFFIRLFRRIFVL